MNTLVKKISTGVITTGLFALTAVPSAFAADITVGGNGSFSRNDVDVRSNNDVDITQRNNANISNTVNTYQNTGGNRANFNTGGDVAILTGDARSDVDIVNRTGSNILNVDNLSGHNRNFDVAVVGNGSFSRNDVDVRSNNDLNINQSNNTRIDNDVTVRQNTGNNRVFGSTSDTCYYGNSFSDRFFVSRFLDREHCDNDGNVTISTGDANSRVHILNVGGSNILR